QKVIKVYPQQGRFIRSTDDDRRRRVVFIGESTRKKLKLPENPIGEFISLSGEWFRIIGVAEERGSLFGFDQDNYIIAPFSTMASLAGSRVTENIDIMFRPAAGANLDSIQA
ncbi:ABC transporter permease, partial [Bowmanella dokdonensis]